ncbi:hypothetical protein V8C40DRAFT_234796 [Trichoderma camerunense]
MHSVSTLFIHFRVGLFAAPCRANECRCPAITNDRLELDSTLIHTTNKHLPSQSDLVNLPDMHNVIRIPHRLLARPKRA